MMHKSENAGGIVSTEAAMDREDLLQLAIRQAADDVSQKMATKTQVEIIPCCYGDGGGVEEANHRSSLSRRLLSQEENIDQPCETMEEFKPTAPGDFEAGISQNEKGTEEAEIRLEEIVRELKKVKSQNRVTHYLLSAVLVMTTVWQLSEVSLLLYLKEALKHPFKAIGGLITGSSGRANEPDATKTESMPKQTLMQALPLPHQIKIPELPTMDLSSLVLNGKKE